MSFSMLMKKFDLRCSQFLWKLKEPTYWEGGSTLTTTLGHTWSWYRGMGSHSRQCKEKPIHYFYFISIIAILLLIYRVCVDTLSFLKCEYSLPSWMVVKAFQTMLTLEFRVCICCLFTSFYSRLQLWNHMNIMSIVNVKTFVLLPCSYI
jgi:hypothetical protein